MLKKKFITGLWVLAAFCMLPAMPAMADETDTETPAKIIYMEEEEAAEPETAAAEEETEYTDEPDAEPEGSEAAEDADEADAPEDEPAPPPVRRRMPVHIPACSG